MLEGKYIGEVRHISFIEKNSAEKPLCEDSVPIKIWLTAFGTKGGNGGTAKYVSL